MKYLKSKDHIWRLLFCRTVLTIGTMYILADSKRTSVPWRRFHITWKSIHCPEASVSGFLLPAMDAKTTTREGYAHGLAWSATPLFSGKLHSLQAGSLAQNHELIPQQFSLTFFQINSLILSYWLNSNCQMFSLLYPSTDEMQSVQSLGMPKNRLQKMLCYAVKSNGRVLKNNYM